MSEESWGSLTRKGLLRAPTAMRNVEPPRAPSTFTEAQALAWRLGWENGRASTQDDIRRDISEEGAKR